jgi:redox-sensitive bicupin YhaK (pirin superfamily)
MGSLWGKTAPTTQHAATIYADIVMTAGSSVPIAAEADERAVLVAIGDASLDGQPLERHALHILAPGVAMTLTATTDARVMLLGGEAFATKRHVWWNFVSSDRERINQAKADWKAGAFPKVPGDEAEWIPIPEVPLTQA